MYTFKFARICVRGLLILLVLQSIVASPRDMGYVDEEDQIPGTNEAFIHFIKNTTNSFCTCGRSVLQHRFCNNDFAIIGRKFGRTTRFYGDPEYEGLHYGGVVIPIAVQQVFRGSMKVHSIVNLHYILGSHCGVDRSSVPEDDQLFLITGFQNKFLKRKNKDDVSPSLADEEGKELFLVTSCGDCIKLSTLSRTQIAGVFLNYYCGEMAITTPTVYITHDAPSSTNTCYFHYSKVKCYDKYAICLSINDVGTWRAIHRIPALPPVLSAIPVDLHEIVKSNEGLGDQDFFEYCIFHVDLPSPEIPIY
ncbi:unnamed protein product [Hymenolepis diminuta]|uniref:Uncharacterized protein n=1 Tax=Hymenolepis diminuta TaxID=6216 RepID=A0A564YLQ8_HYMDI|nr:unnamed protein product [Hymenolepis diminuta]